MPSLADIVGTNAWAKRTQKSERFHEVLNYLGAFENLMTYQRHNNQSQLTCTKGAGQAVRVIRIESTETTPTKQITLDTKLGVTVATLHHLRRRVERVKRLIQLNAPEIVRLSEAMEIVGCLEHLFEDGLDGMPSEDEVYAIVEAKEQREYEERISQRVREVKNKLGIKGHDPTLRWLYGLKDNPYGEGWAVDISSYLIRTFGMYVVNAKDPSYEGWDGKGVSYEDFEEMFKLEEEENTSEDTDTDDEDEREVFDEKIHLFYWDTFYKDPKTRPQFQALREYCDALSNLCDTVMETYAGAMESKNETLRKDLDEHPLVTELFKAQAVVHTLTTDREVHWKLVQAYIQRWADLPPVTEDENQDDLPMSEVREMRYINTVEEVYESAQSKKNN